jgi:6-pyruvoyltetrahydropterin/6-carboxytetrahydropterin synthase
MLEPSDLSTEVLIEVSFEAAHQLSWHPGKCKALHGHSYRAQVAIGGSIDGNGIIADFTDLREVIQQAAIRVYDHRLLNEILDNPTAELLAHDLMRRLCDAGLRVTEIVLWETPRSAVRVRPKQPTPVVLR